MAANLALQVSDRERAYMSDLNDLIRDPSSTLAQINWFREMKKVVGGVITQRLQREVVHCLMLR